MRSDTQISVLFCMRCAQEAFRVWEGWCSKGATDWSEERKERLCLPDLPRLQNGHCPECGSEVTLKAEQVCYANCHGPWNTGLPNCFVLQIVDETESKEAHHRWGAPYTDKGVGRIPWPEMLRRIEDFDRKQRLEREAAEYRAKHFVGGGYGWFPGLGYSSESAKSSPDGDTVSRQLELLIAHWPEIVGESLAAVTLPMKLTGRKKRRLVVWADAAANPPWGSWSTLSTYLRERRAFTRFRTAINEALAPIHVDHVEFVTTERFNEIRS